MRKIDYTKFNTDGSRPDDIELDKRWWTGTKEDRFQRVTKVVRFLAEYDSYRQTQYQVSERLYGNEVIMGVNGLSITKASAGKNVLKDRISYNVVKAAIDTVVAKMAKNKPRPMFLTSGGDYKLQKKAKKLDKFIEGVLYENKADELNVDIIRDAGVWGDGFVHVFECDGRVKLERVMAKELFVDRMESFYGHPRQKHRVKNIDRQVLMDLYKSKASQINDANGASDDLTGSTAHIADQVTVCESFHLPSGIDAKDGLHTISIENCTLFEEKWEKPYFPYAKMSWSKRLSGYFAQSGAEEIQNIQLEINKILWVIQRSMHLAGTFKVFLENGSKIVKEHLNNDIGAIVNYTGTEPKYLVPPIVPVEMYNHLKDLKNSAFEQFGISQLSASSLKPAGLDSGKALRAYHDIETERFTTLGNQFEGLYLQESELILDVAKDINESSKKFKVQVPNKTFIETINWKDVDLEKDEFFMKIYPVSALPEEPAGRLQTVQEYIQAGFMSARTGRKLLDFPDLESVEERQNAKEDYLTGILDKIIEEGEYTSPEPFDDLQLAKELVLEYYAKAKTNNVEEEKLDLLRTFSKQVDAELGLAQQGQQILQQQAQSQVAPANATATPTSDLIPNVNPGNQGA